VSENGLAYLVFYPCCGAGDTEGQCMCRDYEESQLGWGCKFGDPNGGVCSNKKVERRLLREELNSRVEDF